jgi:hypothetical protein
MENQNETKKPLKINEEYEIVFSEDFEKKIVDFTVLVGDALRGMHPYEKFYALKMVMEDLEGRVSMYTAMQQMVDARKD